jgi:hypothetical protein
MRVGENQQPMETACGRYLTRIIRALMGLPASGGRFHDDEPGVGPKRLSNAVVAHGARSEISGSPTTLRKALQKRMSRG